MHLRLSPLVELPIKVKLLLRLFDRRLPELGNRAESRLAVVLGQVFGREVFEMLRDLGAVVVVVAAFAAGRSGPRDGVAGSDPREDCGEVVFRLLRHVGKVLCDRKPCVRPCYQHSRLGSESVSTAEEAGRWIRT